MQYLQYRPLAVGTAWRKELMVVFVTVRPSLSLKEACCAQLSLTDHAHKVLRVPHFTQCCNHLNNKSWMNWKRLVWFCLNLPSSWFPFYLSHNAFVTRGTVAFGCGPHTNLLQIRAQPSQKVIYRICCLSLDGGLWIWNCWAAAAVAVLLF